jgi:hypothetical protein
VILHLKISKIKEICPKLQVTHGFMMQFKNHRKEHGLGVSRRVKLTLKT